jgi:DNA-binding protein WhiA
MSFTKEVKEELCQYQYDECCLFNELKAILRISSSIIIQTGKRLIEYQTSNLIVCERVIYLLNKVFNVSAQLIEKEEKKLNIKHMYIILIDEKVDKIIIAFNLFNLNIEYANRNLKSCCESAYIRGAFLNSGSINDPEKSYHLEININNKTEAILVQKIMNKYNLNAKIAKRRNSLIVYIKEADKISDFLKLINATKNFLKYEDIKITKDFKNSLNRVIVCEIANEQKTLKAAKSQIEQINFIKKHLSDDKIDDKILLVMNLRLDNPDSSLNELKDIAFEEYNVQLSKSCLNHRFMKIKELYENLLNEKFI